MMAAFECNGSMPVLVQQSGGKSLAWFSGLVKDAHGPAVLEDGEDLPLQWKDLSHRLAQMLGPPFGIITFRIEPMDSTRREILRSSMYLPAAWTIEWRATAHGGTGGTWHVEPDFEATGSMSDFAKAFKAKLAWVEQEIADNKAVWGKRPWLRAPAPMGSASLSSAPGKHSEEEEERAAAAEHARGAPTGVWTASLIKVLKQVHPETDITAPALDSIHTKLIGLLERLVKAAVAATKGRSVITQAELDKVVNDVIGGELAEHGIGEADKVIKKAAANPTATSNAQRYGLTFSVSTMADCLSKAPKTPGWFGIPSALPAVYFTAIIEYIGAEILEIAGNHILLVHKKRRIRLYHLRLALTYDEELKALFPLTEKDNDPLDANAASSSSSEARGLQGRRRAETRARSTRTAPSTRYEGEFKMNKREGRGNGSAGQMYAGEFKAAARHVVGLNGPSMTASIRV